MRVRVPLLPPDKGIPMEKIICDCEFASYEIFIRCPVTGTSYVTWTVKRDGKIIRWGKTYRRDDLGERFNLKPKPESNNSLADRAEDEADRWCWDYDIYLRRGEIHEASMKLKKIQINAGTGMDFFAHYIVLDRNGNIVDENEMKTLGIESDSGYSIQATAEYRQSGDFNDMILVQFDEENFEGFRARFVEEITEWLQAHCAGSW